MTTTRSKLMVAADKTAKRKEKQLRRKLRQSNRATVLVVGKVIETASLNIGAMQRRT